MLFQSGADGEMKLVQCLSKKTSEAERRYHSTKLELMAIVWCLDKLRNYLIGIHATIVTDCQALIYMNASKTRNSQIARWASFLAEFDIEIRHRPGEKMQHVDALSRAPVGKPSNTEDDIVGTRCDVLWSMSESSYILAIQHSDSELKEVIRILKINPENRSEVETNRVRGYRLKNDSVYKAMGVEGDEKLLYVVPKSMRKAIAVKFHDLRGHFGVDRTVAAIKEKYWFAGMRRYIKLHIRLCGECIVNKMPGGKRAGLLNPISPGNRPFETIHIDHLGPFARSRKGNSHLLVIVDNLTKVVKLNPCPDTSVKGVIQALKDMILDYGVPDRIISDRGTCFTSQKFEEFCLGFGIIHVLNSVRHPQANGQVERVNRTVLPIIQAYMKDEYDWDENIKSVQRDMNAAFNKTTGVAPIEALLGYVPWFTEGALKFLAKLEGRRDPKEIRREITTRIKEAQTAWKETYDQRHFKATNFEVGEIVFMRRAPSHTGDPRKAQPKYRGPLVITEVLSGDTYRVNQLGTSPDGRVYATTVHVSLLKGFGGTSQDEDEMSEQDEEEEKSGEDEEDEEQVEYEVSGGREDGGNEEGQLGLKYPEDKEILSEDHEEEGDKTDQAGSGTVEDGDGKREPRQRRLPKYLEEYEMDSQSTRGRCARQDGRM